MTEKIIAILLALSMAATLAACSKRGESETESVGESEESAAALDAGAPDEISGSDSWSSDEATSSPDDPDPSQNGGTPPNGFDPSQGTPPDGFDPSQGTPPNGFDPSQNGGTPRNGFDPSQGGFGYGQGGASAPTSSDGTPLIDASEQFTERDLTQSADTTGASKIALKSGGSVTIDSEGVYVISGTATNATVTVDAPDEAKVQLVLDGVSITNDDFPAIYVKNADKVFVTTTATENTLAVTGAFRADGDTNTDAVIFSRDDLVINGVGTLTVSSTANGISSKDDLKITGGTLSIDCAADALEANDSIRIADGNITIRTDKDGLHAENDEDDSLGYVYIGGGTLSITAVDDAVHATTIAQIDGGELTISAAEGVEGTQVQINDGKLTISASDDGINASAKSLSYAVKAEINGGYTKITMGAGDTDGVDSNGSLFINGGTLDITGQSPFDCDGTVQKNGGTVIVNGTETDAIVNQFGGMGPGGGGGMGPGRRR